MYGPACIGLMSHFPYLNLMKYLLVRLYNIFKQGSTGFVSATQDDGNCNSSCDESNTSSVFSQVILLAVVADVHLRAIQEVSINSPFTL